MWTVALTFLKGVPRFVWIGIGIVILLSLVFNWGVAVAGAQAKLATEKALREQAEAHVEQMRAIMETVSAANAQVGKTEVRVIRETDNARRAIEAVPGAQRPVDPEAWRIALATMERIRAGELRDGASGGDDPPIGGIVARPVS